MPRPDLTDATPAELQLELLGRAIYRHEAEIARVENQLATMRSKQLRRRAEITITRDRAIAERGLHQSFYSGGSFA